MSNLINFFFSFDKLMKEKLVIVFFWLSAIVIALGFAKRVFAAIWLSPIAKLLAFFEFFVCFALAIVMLRLLCELAIALFRINDNLSPDGGKSETADIDPILEARKVAKEAQKAAEDAAKKASVATKAAVNRSRHDGETADPAKKSRKKDKAEPSADASSKSQTPKKKPAAKKDASKKTTAKPAAKKAPAKKTSAKKATPKKTTSKSAAKKDSAPKKKPESKPKT